MDGTPMAYYEHRVAERRRQVALLERNLKSAKEDLHGAKQFLMWKMERDIDKLESELKGIKKLMRESGEKFPVLSTDGSRRAVVERLAKAKRVVIMNGVDWESFKEMWEYSLNRNPSITIEVILHHKLDRRLVKSIKTEAVSESLKNSLRIIQTGADLY